MRFILSTLILVASFTAVASPRFSYLSAETEASIVKGAAVDLIVEFDAADIERDAEAARQQAGLNYDDAGLLAVKAQRYSQLKGDVEAAVAEPDVRPVRDYGHLPMAVWRVSSSMGLDRLGAHPRFKAAYEDTKMYPVDSVSFPLINQPPVAAAGEAGAGTTVAVIDTGIDYANYAQTSAELGYCTGPATPATCKVAVSINVPPITGTGTGTGADQTHGTNVSAVALGVAPASQVAMLNVFTGGSAYSSDVLYGIDWAITNQAAYHITAINLSLGDGSKNQYQCPSSPYSAAVSQASQAGIVTVVAAGNSGYAGLSSNANGLASPACTPGVVSVGAVYDKNYGAQGWYTVSPQTCTDSTTAADQVTCFSNSATYLTLLAPGSYISAAGITDSGTSQATPHVTGAVTVLRAQFPSESLSQTVARLTSYGKPVTDARNNLNFPRLDLLAAARPLNDNFANRTAISGTSGQVTGTNLLATLEAGEPAHAGNAGGHSVWWKFTPSASGQVSLDTHGSSFATLLAVYTGSTIASLTPVAANISDGSPGGTSGLLFQGRAGQEYEIAVDGYNGAAGSTVLNWSLNTTAAAALSLTASGPTSAVDGATSSYTLTVTNNGPQVATNVKVTDTLPTAASFVSATSGCAFSAGVVSCAAGTLAVGGSASFTITVTWTGSGNLTDTAAASSDLPNPNPAGSSTTVTTTVMIAQPVPALPEQAMLVLAASLMFVAWRQTRQADDIAKR